MAPTLAEWKKYQKSGTYRRIVTKLRKQTRQNLEHNLRAATSSISTGFAEEDGADDEMDTQNDVENAELTAAEDNAESVAAELHTLDSKDELDTFLRCWAINHNIRQVALKPLLSKLIEYGCDLPKDPRTLMLTPKRQHVFTELAGGTYWHQGLEFCLRNTFSDLQQSLSISININIDGLPIHKNGRDEFWPILYNVHEMPQINPMIIAIFYGKCKPKKVEEFLKPFVDEILPILENGVSINGFKLDVKIRCFICDSPARSLIKGERVVETFLYLYIYIIFPQL